MKSSEKLWGKGSPSHASRASLASLPLASLATLARAGNTATCYSRRTPGSATLSTSSIVSA